MAMNPNGNLRITNNNNNGGAGGASGGGGVKVDPRDPQVRKLVYNMYRGMLDQKHQKANVILDSTPQQHITKDEGVGSRVQSMMRQQHELKGGNINAGGPPPPPPPPPIPGVLPASRLSSELPTSSSAAMNPPAALAGAMLKDKKPFTYTPGGLDLSEINSQNGGDPSMAPVQSRSFKLLQNVLDTHDTTESPSTGVPMKVEVCPGSPKRTPANINNGPRVFTSATNQGGGGYRVIPVQQQQQQQQQGGGDDTRYITPTTKQMGGYKANGSNPNQMSNIFKNQVRVNSDNDEARGRGGYFPAPKTVVVTQRMEPQGPVHIPNLRQPQQQQQQQQPKPFQPNYQQFQNPGVSSNPGASEQEVPEPKKYMGGSIPSRSFRMLQAMTGPDEASDNGAPATEITNTTTQPPDGDKKVHAANHNNHPPPQPQPPSLSSPPPSSSSTTPLLTSTTTTTTNNDMYSSDSGISSPSKVSPTYTTTKDSRVYRNVAPKINVNGSKRERIVNSALTHKEPSSPYSNNSSSSSPTWKVNPATTKFFPPSVSSSSSGQEADRNSPRLMTIIRQESASPQDPPPELTERRYEGGHIPSRVFRHLQSEYPSTPGGEEGDDTNQDSRPRHQGSSPIPPRVIKSLQNQNNANNSFESDASSSYGELDEYYSNGATKTAVNKDTVLKELTSQFDHSLGTRKKPKAAPGRVFKYLQAQYDTPDDPNTHHEPQQQQQQEEEEEVNSLGYRGSKLPSPSFRYLQNQYHQEQQQQQQQQSVEPPTPDAPNYEDEPMPYRGARTPGRTFRSIQENGAAHPSVFGNRK